MRERERENARAAGVIELGAPPSCLGTRQCLTITTKNNTHNGHTRHCHFIRLRIRLVLTQIINTRHMAHKMCPVVSGENLCSSQPVDCVQGWTVRYQHTNVCWSAFANVLDGDDARINNRNGCNWLAARRRVAHAHDELEFRQPGRTVVAAAAAAATARSASASGCFAVCATNDV